MGTMYIDRKGVELRLEGKQMQLHEPGGSVSRVPLSHLDRIILHGRGSLDSRLLGALSEQGIAMVILQTGRYSQSVSIPGRSHKDAARRLAQYRRSLDENWKARVASIIVAKKIRAQKGLLKNALTQRPDQRYVLSKSMTFLSQRLSRLGAMSLNRETLRGIEGSAAVAYFKAYSKLFPPSLEFTGRNRRPPRDPVNACLSLAYTLLQADAVMAIQAAGLDPMLGFYHDTSFGRDSLACDVIEPLRPVIDKWVWDLFRHRGLRKEYFSVVNDACLLHKTGRKIFYLEWEAFSAAHRRRMKHILRILLRAVLA